ncbi:recombinase family protein [Corynebacterium belfantii]|uniref:recombinase family protein n=1 Tax=Corynebacterium belfantii TaxID=2014537 RepID=UPI0018D2D3FD|nr:recombinase family protein [Corynebacterium belfantii]MBG9326516.1 recombinase family protein [Corynebacterium belfantii]MBG9330769.1 recombinase family protein [Corynebacterium belfantii]
MIIGYARVSTDLQKEDLQVDALQSAGAEKIFIDHSSGAARARPELEALLAHLRPGDVVVVWRLDRLGRSVQHLIEIMADLQERGVEFKSLHEQIDTTTPMGRFTFHLFAALAEFERDLIRSRTHAGLAAARSRGRVGGRKPVLSPQQAELVKSLYHQQGSTAVELAKLFNVSRATIYRTVNKKIKSSKGGSQRRVDRMS